MIVNADVVGLEVATAAWLSQDEVLLRELRNKVNIHSVNQERFGLPTRLIAKTLKFRILYGGSAYAFSMDPQFKEVSTKVEYWEKVINEYYKKYQGLYLWHRKLVYEATTTRQVICPTGRFFRFEPKLNYKGEPVWPTTTIKNYPVQGTGADLVSLARIEFYKKLREEKLNDVVPVATVHDSIVVDCVSERVDDVSRLLHHSISSIPRLYAERFGGELNVPISAEVSVGPNFADLNDYPTTS